MQKPTVSRLLILVLLLTFALASFWQTTHLLAQTGDLAEQEGGVIWVDKQLGRNDSLVFVGQYLTFTIFIENQTNFTVTVLPISDTYNSEVLQYVDATINPDSHVPSTGRLDWNDLTTSIGDMPPGSSHTLVVGFIAVSPAPVVVNRAEVHDAESSNGGVNGGDSTSGEAESVGGSFPVDKTLLSGLPAEVGDILTFTIEIRNQGFTTATVVPFIEDYDPNYLQFVSSDPLPETIDEVTGALLWEDLTVYLGDMPPNGTYLITTYFRAVAPVEETVNGAGVSGGEDWYGNDMGDGNDFVPIRIIDQGEEATATPNATVTVQATATVQGTATVQATATSQATVQATATRQATVQATVASQATATPASIDTTSATSLPSTGVAPSVHPFTWVLAMLALVLPVAFVFLRRHR